jgi:hypothetical protein
VSRGRLGAACAPTLNGPDEVHLVGVAAPIHQGMDVGPNINNPGTLPKGWKASTNEQVLSQFAPNGLPGV